MPPLNLCVCLGVSLPGAGPSDPSQPLLRAPLYSAPAPQTYTEKPALWSQKQVWPQQWGLWDQTQSWWGAGRVPTRHLGKQRVPGRCLWGVRQGACVPAWPWVRVAQWPGLGQQCSGVECDPEVTGPRAEEFCTQPQHPGLRSSRPSSSPRPLTACALCLRGPACPWATCRARSSVQEAQVLRPLGSGAQHKTAAEAPLGPRLPGANFWWRRAAGVLSGAPLFVPCALPWGAWAASSRALPPCRAQATPAPALLPCC